LGDGRALAHVAAAPVIHETAVESCEVIMPAQLDAIWSRSKTARIAHLVGAGCYAGNLLSSFDAVFRRDDHSPVVGLVADAGAGVHHVDTIETVTVRPVPVDEHRRSKIAI